MRANLATAIVFLCAGYAAAAGAESGIPKGNGQQTATLPGTAFQVYTYRPAKCEPRMLMLVFHGIGRNAGAYRDHARPLADRICAVVVAPEFDKARFAQNLYQYGGLEAPPGRRTVDLAPQLAEWSRRAAGNPALPVVLLGHSAGAQFLDRVAAFAGTDAVRIVVANPSTWVWPSETVDVPFGFGGVPSSATALQTYLALPITVLLGTSDLLTKSLDISPPAMAQGPNRYMRGQAVFRAAQASAQEHGWPFRWRLLEVPGVGHDATKMFGSTQAVQALTP